MNGPEGAEVIPFEPRIGHNEAGAIAAFIEKRRAIWAARVPSAVKVIALAILEHMRPDQLECWPSKDRLAFMCNMPRATFDRHFAAARELFHYQDRRGRTTVFSPKILDVAKELAVLWPTNPAVAPRKYRYSAEPSPKLRGGYEKPLPKMREGQNEPPLKMTLPQTGAEPPLNLGDRREGIDKLDPSLRSGPSDAGLEPGQIVWGQGVDWLASASGVSVKSLRPIVGKWLKVLTFTELLHAMRSAAKAKTGDPIAYIGAFVASAKQAEHSVRRENGRLVVMNGFRAELEAILAGRDLQRSLDQIAGKIPIGIAGIELETKVRSMAIELVDRVADQDRRYAAAAEKAKQKTSLSGSDYSLSGNYSGKTL